MISSKHRNGYFLEQEALRGHGNSQVLCVLVLLSFLKFRYIHIVEILKLFRSCHPLMFLMLLSCSLPKSSFYLSHTT